MFLVFAKGTVDDVPERNSALIKILRWDFRLTLRRSIAITGSIECARHPDYSTVKLQRYS